MTPDTDDPQRLVDLLARTVERLRTTLERVQADRIDLAARLAVAERERDELRAELERVRGASSLREIARELRAGEHAGVRP